MKQSEKYGAFCIFLENGECINYQLDVFEYDTLIKNIESIISDSRFKPYVKFRDIDNDIIIIHKDFLIKNPIKFVNFNLKYNESED